MFLLTMTLLLPSLTQALPIRTGMIIQVQIPGEYIVIGEISNNSKSIRSLGKDLSLVQGDLALLEKTSNTIFHNFKYLGNPMEMTPMIHS